MKDRASTAEDFRSHDGHGSTGGYGISEDALETPSAHTADEADTERARSR